MEPITQSAETPNSPSIPENPAIAEKPGLGGEPTPENGGPESQAVENGAIPTGESATPNDAEQEQEQEHKRRSGFQKRVDRLNRQKQEIEQRAAALEAENQRLMQERLAATQESGEPTLEQYDYDNDQWSAAYKTWVQEGIQRQQEQMVQASQRQKAEIEAHQRQQDIQRKAFEARKQYPDFIEKVFDPSLPSLSEVNPVAFDAVTGSPQMADIAYYLANNPEEVYSFSEMSPVQSVRAVLELEAKLKTPAPQANSPSPPNPPPSALPAGNDSVKDPSKMSMDEWVKWRTGSRNR